MRDYWLCQRKGSLLWFVPRVALKLTTPEANSKAYTFNQPVIRHHFCPVCGIHPYGEGTDPKGEHMAAINIRCLDGIDLEKIPVNHYDGRAA